LLPNTAKVNRTLIVCKGNQADCGVDAQVYAHVDASNNIKDDIVVNREGGTDGAREDVTEDDYNCPASGHIEGKCRELSDWRFN
jgi:hypothetical protein